MRHLRDNTHCLQGGISVSVPCCHEFPRLMARSSKTNLVPAIVHGVTCFFRRFAVYGRGSAAELAVKSWSSVLHVTLWRRHLQNLSLKVVLSGGTATMGWVNAWRQNRQRGTDMCAIVVFTGGTAMIQGINEHVANDLTELFPQLENKEVAASPERKYSLMS